MKKKTYICPAQKVLKIETASLLNVSGSGIPIGEGTGDQQLSKGYSNIWAAMSADDNAAASQQGDDDEDDF